MGTDKGARSDTRREAHGRRSMDPRAGRISMAKSRPSIGKRTAWPALTFALALALAPIPAYAEDAADAERPELFLEDVSPQGFVATVDAFRETVADAGWSILGTTNMAGVLSERGYTIDPVLVLKPCSGAYSSELLGRDETRFVASMIPCRVAIYKTSTGDVIISRINTAAMAGMIGGDAAPVIEQSGEELEQIIRTTLEKLSP
jgi:uncharacterized protein (DUF302 family)